MPSPIPPLPLGRTAGPAATPAGNAARAELLPQPDAGSTDKSPSATPTARFRDALKKASRAGAGDDGADKTEAPDKNSAARGGRTRQASSTSKSAKASKASKATKARRPGRESAADDANRVGDDTQEADPDGSNADDAAAASEAQADGRSPSEAEVGKTRAAREHSAHPDEGHPDPSQTTAAAGDAGEPPPSNDAPAGSEAEDVKSTGARKAVVRATGAPPKDETTDAGPQDAAEAGDAAAAAAAGAATEPASPAGPTPDAAPSSAPARPIAAKDAAVPAVKPARSQPDGNPVADASPAVRQSSPAAANTGDAPDDFNAAMEDLSSSAVAADRDGGPSQKAQGKSITDLADAVAGASDPAAGKAPAHAHAASAPAPPDAPPEARFADANHDKIVTGVRAELLPNGGAMHLRLDPPELGDLLVSVEMHNGVMTAAFQTTNDEATRLLSHSLGDLKALLESQGVTVEKMHVQQAPRQEPGGGGESDRRSTSPEDQNNARREQQRREMVQRLWDKLAKGKDPLDLVA